MWGVIVGFVVLVLFLGGFGLAGLVLKPIGFLLGELWTLLFGSPEEREEQRKHR